MRTDRVGIGSQYGIIAVDSDRNYLDGSKTYKVTLHSDITAKDFWSFTVYDPQTRSMLQAPPTAFPTLSSAAGNPEFNEDGSVTVWFGPLESWFDKTWKPGEIEQVE